MKSFLQLYYGKDIALCETMLRFLPPSPKHLLCSTVPSIQSENLNLLLHQYWMMMVYQPSREHFCKKLSQDCFSSRIVAEYYVFYINLSHSNNKITQMSYEAEQMLNFRHMLIKFYLLMFVQQPSGRIVHYRIYKLPFPRMYYLYIQQDNQDLLNCRSLVTLQCYKGYNYLGLYNLRCILWSCKRLKI